MYSNQKQTIRDAISFRYRLSPYLYSLEYRAHTSGLPIMEAMFLAFQNDPATYDEGVDFMLGDNLLVANVVEKGAKTRTVRFPVPQNSAERFYNFYTREPYQPGEKSADEPDDRKGEGAAHSDGAGCGFHVHDVRR